MSITTDIKDFSLDIGYSKVGITSADDFQGNNNEVLSRGKSIIINTKTLDNC